MIARDAGHRFRAERFVPGSGILISAFRADSGRRYLGKVENISRTGIGLSCPLDTPDLAPGAKLETLELVVQDQRFVLGSAMVARVVTEPASAYKLASVGIAFRVEQLSVLERLRPVLKSYEYVTGELSDGSVKPGASELDASDYTLDMFLNRPRPDLFAKCESFRPWVDDLIRKQLFQRLWRVTMTGALDHRITVFDSVHRCERSMLCFDSNSYLGLHLHPRVVERVVEVLRKVGSGTASAQMLCGTNRYLRELEEELSEFLGREDTMVFPTGFAANVGAIGALVRHNDAVLRDRFAHASIQEGCRSSAARFSRVFGHNNMTSLVTLLKRATAAGCDGKLIATDGVFSMHGRIAPLPQLVQIAKQHQARLMVDDAHGVGVLGATGRGIEEHFGMPGSVDVLMGTLSKSLGAVGGYVSGSRDLIYYLRFYAASGMFTTSLPAATCAGLREAIRVIRQEPEHRTQLWKNIHQFVPALREAGFIVPDAVSPIVTLFMGSHTLMLEFSRDLFDAGVKCGNVMYPAVAKGESILRLTLNARHSAEDLERALEVLTSIGKKWGILHRSAEEISAMGRAVRLRGGEASILSTDREPVEKSDAFAVRKPNNPFGSSEATTASGTGRDSSPPQWTDIADALP